MELSRAVAGAFFGVHRSLRPVQEATIPLLLQGKNVVASSGTGSGKTEAATAPLVDRYLSQLRSDGGPAILYVAPTKALVNDLVRRLEPPLAALDVPVWRRHGDADDTRRAGAMRGVLVTTPESLDVLMSRADGYLAGIRAAVLDEVHLLYNSQRGLQLALLLSRLRIELASPLQWTALSATVADLSAVRDFLFGPDEPAEFVECPSTRTIGSHIRHTASESSFTELMAKLMERPRKILLFANSRRECDRLATLLEGRLPAATAVLVHFSSLSPEVREETEKKFAETPSAVCIATSTLELGIDIGDIDSVVLWGAPSSTESFLQRIGRGNRRRDSTSVVCLIPDTSEGPAFEGLLFQALIEASRAGELPRDAAHELYGAVGQQALGIVASRGGAYTMTADLAAPSAPWLHLQRSTVERILGELNEQGYLQRHGFKNSYGADEELWRLVDFRMIYGNMPMGSMKADVYQGSRRIGEVPAANLLRMRRGSLVQFAGQKWSVRKLTPDGVWLEPSRASGKHAPMKYEGSKASLDINILNRICRLVKQGAPVEQETHSGIGPSMTELAHLLRPAANGEIPTARVEGGYLHVTLAGAVMNRVLAFSQDIRPVKVSDAWLITSTEMDWESLPSDPKAYVAVLGGALNDTGASLFQNLLPHDLRLAEYVQQWTCSQGVVEALERLSVSRVTSAGPSLLRLLGVS